MRSLLRLNRASRSTTIPRSRQIHRPSLVLTSSFTPKRSDKTPRRDGPAAALATRPTDDDVAPLLSHGSRIPPVFSSSSSKADDELLKAHFDKPGPSSISSSTPTGIFQMEPFTHPQALEPLAERTLFLCNKIVERIRAAPKDTTGRELRLVIKNLDRVSDILCGVIDACELIRNMHPDPKWVKESDRCHERLSAYLNSLNVDVGLYESLAAAVDRPHSESLTFSDTQVASVFLNDFRKSGIDLSPSLRAKFVKHSDRLLTLTRTFQNQAASSSASAPLIEIPDADRLLLGMGSQFISSLPRRGDRAYVAPNSWEAHMIARYAREGEARRLVYIGNQSPEPDKAAVLNEMLSERAQLAGVLGKESWADVALVDKMAKNPGNVDGFLRSLLANQRPAALADVATLQRLKAHSITGNHYPSDQSSTAHLPPLNAWDKDFYGWRYVSSMAESSSSSISNYLSVGSAMMGLSRLFSRLYGISFKPVPVAPGETWDPSVRRIDVVDEVEGPIGRLYLDLFERPGKAVGAAHYTVRCSRRIDDDDVAGDGLSEGWDAQWGKGLEGRGTVVRGREGRYQLPVSVLSCELRPPSNGRPALLTWNELETLFHEMGHAIHSMIGRTEYHNVSGTRCSTDFVELPSILMELFVASPAVLDLFATHHVTGEPLPHSLLQSHLDVQQSLSALEQHNQILLAMMDQRLHLISPSESGSVDSTSICHDLHQALNVIAPVEGTGQHTQLMHLAGYAATYYSYLLDRALAVKVFATLFNHTPTGTLSRENGEIFREKVLKWGGGKDPWEMLASVVGGEEGETVARGDEKAMEVVGGWVMK